MKDNLRYLVAQPPSNMYTFVGGRMFAHVPQPGHGIEAPNQRTGSMAPNYAFKPTAGEVIRFNQPLLAGGGLTRR
jgi:hypothetical protein